MFNTHGQGGTETIESENLETGREDVSRESTF